MVNEEEFDQRTRHLVMMFLKEMVFERMNAIKRDSVHLRIPRIYRKQEWLKAHSFLYLLSSLSKFRRCIVGLARYSQIRIFVLRFRDCSHQSWNFIFLLAIRVDSRYLKCDIDVYQL